MKCYFGQHTLTKVTFLLTYKSQTFSNTPKVNDFQTCQKSQRFGQTKRYFLLLQNLPIHLPIHSQSHLPATHFLTNTSIFLEISPSFLLTLYRNITVKYLLLSLLAFSHF